MKTVIVDVPTAGAWQLLEDLAALNIIHLHPTTANQQAEVVADRQPARRFGFAQNLIQHIADDFDAPLPEFAAYVP
jgi:hypothetical protein